MQNISVGWMGQRYQTVKYDFLNFTLFYWGYVEEGDKEITKYVTMCY